MFSIARVRVPAAAAAAALAAFTMQPGYAEEPVCVGQLGAVSIDNLHVPSGRSCRLDSTQIKGNIKVERNATLVAGGVRVAGNIQAENARHVRVSSGSSVGGSIQIKQGGAATISGVRVDGDIQFEANTRSLSATDNRVGGKVQVLHNDGGVSIAGNLIDGELQCKENRPAPIGGGNRVRGNKEDPCSRL
mgnify:CR=1 FL=1|jgi:hypothetical protein